MKKKLLSFLMTTVLVLTTLSLQTTTPDVQAATFDDLNQSQITAAMGAGWNLGNQFDAYIGTTLADGTVIQAPDETAWGNPVITKNLIDAVANAGFKTIRIPVTWGNKIGSAPNYTIDQTYMNRVKQVVDYAISDNLFVLINIHHDAFINQTLSSNQATINDEFGKVWTQIATTFGSYDEHLIFESMNEIGGDTSHLTQEQLAQVYTSVNAYNQTFVNAVRSTGLNNTKRWLLIPGINTNIDMTVANSFVIPNDSLCTASGKRLMISVHYYGPWEFALRQDDIVTQWGSTAPNPSKTAGWGNEDYMTSQIQSVYNKFVTQGYPVVIGEYGSIDKSQADSANSQSRILYAKTLCEISKQYGAVPIYWDNGYNENHQFGIIDRRNYTITQPGIVNAIVNVFSQTTPTITPGPTATPTPIPANTNISSIRYDFNFTGVTGQTTVSFQYMNNDSSWTTVSTDLTVNGNGNYSVTVYPNASGMRNMGYFATINGSPIVANLTQITVNGSYVLTYTKSLQISSTYANGLNNIWDGTAAGTVIAQGSNAQLKLNSDSSAYMFYTNGSIPTTTPTPTATPTPTPAPTATPTPTPSTLDGIYNIKNVNSNLNLDVLGGSANNNTNIIQYTSNGASNQKFKLVSAGNGYYYIYTGATGYTKVLDVNQKKTADGTLIIQYQYNGGTNQQFEVKQISPGVYSILTRLTSSKSALSVSGASTSTLANIVQRTNTGATDQQWILTATN